MTNEKIRENVDRIYSEKWALDADLETLRSMCKHQDVKIVNYSWRIGAEAPAKVCAYCDQFIKYVNDGTSTITRD